jgi:hypothetical protein
MSDDLSEQYIVMNKVNQNSNKILQLLEVYTYHVLIIISGIIVIGAPLVYSSRVGRSGILSGTFNYNIQNFGGYCYPFHKPTYGEGYSEDKENPGIEAYGNDDNFLITDEISFYHYRTCIKNIFQDVATTTSDLTSNLTSGLTGGAPTDDTAATTTTDDTPATTTDDTPANYENSICKITYGKLIRFDYEYVKKLLTPSIKFLQNFTQIQNLIQYLNLKEMGSIYPLSDEFFTLYNFRENGIGATFFTYFLSILYFLCIEIPLDTLRTIFVVALIIYNFFLGTLLKYISYIIPVSFIEVVLLLFPSILLLMMPWSDLFGLIFFILGIFTYIFVFIFIIYYCIKIIFYIIFIFSSYSIAAEKTDVAFIFMSLLLYIGAIVIIILILLCSPLFIIIYSILVQFLSFFIMIMIFIFCLFFQAKEAKKNGDKYKVDENSATYSYSTFLMGLLYKKSWILLLLLIVFLCDFLNSKIVPLNGKSLGIILVFIIALLIFGFFNNTLLYKDEKSFIHHFFNSYNQTELDKTMIELNEDVYQKYRYTKNLKCEAQFNETTLLQNAFNYPAWSIDGIKKFYDEVNKDKSDS